MWTLAERPKKFIFTLTTVLFVGSIKDSEGNKKSVKYFNKKLKLTKDRIELIEECLGTTILKRGRHTTWRMCPMLSFCGKCAEFERKFEQVGGKFLC